MKAGVYAEGMDGKRRFLGTVIYDNAARAMQLYEDECSEWEQIILIDVVS